MFPETRYFSTGVVHGPIPKSASLSNTSLAKQSVTSSNSTIESNNKPVQKPNGTVAKNSDGITPGSTESGRPATDDDHSSANNSSTNNEKPTSKVNVIGNSQNNSNANLFCS